jgi:hypothetical protein
MRARRSAPVDTAAKGAGGHGTCVTPVLTTQYPVMAIYISRAAGNTFADLSTLGAISATPLPAMPGQAWVAQAAAGQAPARARQRAVRGAHLPRAKQP